jgi:hypothetical protein
LGRQSTGSPHEGRRTRFLCSENKASKPPANFFQKSVDTTVRAETATAIKKSTEIKSLGTAQSGLLPMEL